MAPRKKKMSTAKIAELLLTAIDSGVKKMPNWLIDGGEVIVKVMQLPVYDLSIPYIVEPDGFAASFKRYRFEGPGKFVLEDRIKQELQDDLNKSYAPNPAPVITGIRIVWCEMVPMIANYVPNALTRETFTKTDRGEDIVEGKEVDAILESK